MSNLYKIFGQPILNIKESMIDLLYNSIKNFPLWYLHLVISIESPF